MINLRTKRGLHFLTLIFLIPFSFYSCSEDTDDIFVDDYSTYEPLIMERSALESSIEFISNRQLADAGKIYSYGVYILINEKYEGVHIYENFDPRNPTKLGFIKVPGCIDMAVKDNVLYVDNAVDLIAVDISKLPEITVEKRIQGIFPELTPPDLEYVPYRYTTDRRPENTVIVKWIRK